MGKLKTRVDFSLALRLLRPHFWLLSIVPAASGVLLSLDSLTLKPLMFSMMIAAAISGLAETVNNYVDLDSDDLQLPKTWFRLNLAGGSGIQPASLNKSAALVLAVFFATLAIALSSTLRADTLGVTVLATFMAIGYSLHPFSFKTRGLLGTLDMVLGRGLVSFHIGWTACKSPTRQSILLGLFLSLLNFGSAVLPHLADYAEDKASGIKTFPVSVGFKTAARCAAGGIALALLLFAYMLLGAATTSNFLSLPLFILAGILMDQLCRLDTRHAPAPLISRLQLLSMFIFLLGPFLFL